MGTTKTNDSLALTTSATKPSSTVVRHFVGNQIPLAILNDPNLARAVKPLPANYSFEIHKTIWRLRTGNVSRLALQFPEGLLLYATTLADIFKVFVPSIKDVVILGDVTYGACCVDDYAATALGCDFLVHYGHSCLVPVSMTTCKTLYVFVDILFDEEHLVQSIRKNFPNRTDKIALAGTIQFASAIGKVRETLRPFYECFDVGRTKPLSPGEVLGCTAPSLGDGEVMGARSGDSMGEEGKKAHDAIVFVADGRFHLEAMMIANPNVPAYRYDPYERVLTREYYDHVGMQNVRKSMILRAKKAKKFGLILGTLGRQGNPAVLARLERLFESRNKETVVFLISEISPERIASLSENGGIDAFVQVACPRLSIDWGEAFIVPVLTPYEAYICLEGAEAWDDVNTVLSEGKYEKKEVPSYPMKYYADDGGEWTSSRFAERQKNMGNRRDKPSVRLVVSSGN
jgi:2-(3-amino-3-carboxypropyl)histidine synthase|tara:strand:- start:277 stop:1650 length:1374 start_codon:yes stop_codon:yes gene_type:complete